MQASFAPEGAPTAAASESAAASSTSIALAAFFAPSAQVQVAESAENIPGDFKAPENPPLPPSRPDFGDRVQIAEANVPARAEPPEDATPQAPAPAAIGVANTPPQPASARAEAASLGAYEFKTAGVPLPEGGLRGANIAFAPAQFELAGAGASVGRSGGLRWRAAYDSVETDCFPETLRKALDQLAAHFKSEVLVTSGMRDRGRRGSLHRACKAADVRVAGVSPGEVARVARTIPGINGVGTYRRVAVTHLDVRAERFAWRW
ncbi:MAG: D-Ala-D-Ala carboxypeptidase family metallohydrolase [Beijerinckiaceae bacterium]